MDTSELYIKMCDCEEVQGVIWDIIESDNKQKRVVGARCEDKDHVVRIPDVRTPDVMFFGKTKEDIRQVTLLSQDQIQILLRQFYAKGDKPDAWFPEGSIGLSLVLRKFDEFTMRDNGEVTLFVENTKSFEQLWLQLYMSEVHGKLWIREGWV